jgi:hypothetical protein
VYCGNRDRVEAALHQRYLDGAHEPQDDGAVRARLLLHQRARHHHRLRRHLLVRMSYHLGQSASVPTAIDLYGSAVLWDATSCRDTAPLPLSRFSPPPQRRDVVWTPSRAAMQTLRIVTLRFSTATEKGP